MNILPKKRWHVKTKDNIARVRADEAKHNEKLEEEQLRAILAEQESRTDKLRQARSNEKLSLLGGSAEIGELRLFRDVEAGLNLKVCNEDYEKEKKEEQEKKEKSIGLLTYLGQSVLDSKGLKPWWSESKTKGTVYLDTEKQRLKEESEAKRKARADPLREMSYIDETFSIRRERKRIKEAEEAKRASAHINATMPALFADDIHVPIGKPTPLYILPAPSVSSITLSPGSKKTIQDDKVSDDKSSGKSKQIGFIDLPVRGIKRCRSEDDKIIECDINKKLTSKDKKRRKTKRKRSKHKSTHKHRKSSKHTKYKDRKRHKRKRVSSSSSSSSSSSTSSSSSSSSDGSSSDTSVSEAVNNSSNSDYLQPAKRQKRNLCSSDDLTSCVDNNNQSAVNDGHDMNTEQQRRNEQVDRLRSERLMRERRERERAALVMSRAMGLTNVIEAEAAAAELAAAGPIDERLRSFNSVFNPEIAALSAERRRVQREARNRWRN